MRVQTFYKVFWVISLVLISSLSKAESFFADNHIPDFYQEPGVRAEREYALGPDGTEVIDTFSGILNLNYTDLVVPGTGLDISITRSYQSNQTAPGVLGNYILTGRTTTGIGWNIHFGRVFAVDGLPSGTSPCKTNNEFSDRNPVFELPSGKRMVMYDAVAAYPYDLMSKEYWVGRCLQSGGMMVISPDGTRYTADFHGRYRGSLSAAHDLNEVYAYHVTRIEDINGNYITIDYASPQTHQYTVIEKITASDGREINFTYSSPQGNAALLTEIEANGQSWFYRYTRLPNHGDDYYLLTEVEGPEGLVWEYEYYGQSNGSADANAGYSVKKVVSPYGGITEYTYQRIDSSAFVAVGAIDTVAIRTKVNSGREIKTGTWTYDFSKIGPDEYDKTEVTTPIGREVYIHCSIRSVFANEARCSSREGSLLSKEIYKQNSNTAFQREEYSWINSRKISDQKERKPTRTYFYEFTVARAPSRKTIIRDNQSYVFQHSHYDKYDNPHFILEWSGSDGELKQVGFDYHIDTNNWDIRKVKSELLYDYFEHTGIEREFDENGNIKSHKQYGDETKYTYYATGELKTATDPLGRVKEFNNYFRGIPRKEVHQISDTETITINRQVNNEGYVTHETNGRGFTTEYGYDKLNRINAVKTPRVDDADISIGRSFSSNLIGFPQITCAIRKLTRGNFTNGYCYDGFGRTIAVEADNIKKEIEYDVLGRKTFESNPNSTLGMEFEYDILGRVIKQTHTADNAFVEYDYSIGDNKITVTNERNNSSTFTYRAFSDPNNRDLIKIESPESVVTDIFRYIRGDIRYVKQSDAAETISKLRLFALDHRYQPDYIFNPETGRTEVTTDAIGNMTKSSVGPSEVTHYEYDGLNRLIKIDYPVPTPDVSFTYDENNNVKTAVRGSSKWIYTYDENDNLKSETLEIDGITVQTFNAQYRYNPFDALDQITYPSNLVVDYAPNNLGWPTQVGSFVSNIEYYPNGQVNALEYANGVTTTINLNDRLFPESITASQNVMDLTYGYDAVGNVKSITDNINLLNNLNMDYDGLDRLVVADGPWGTGSIEYNAIDNILRKTIGDFDHEYNYGDLNDQTRLFYYTSGPNQYNFQYDAYSNVTNNGRGRFAYDDASNLIGANNFLRYNYDANNRLTKKTEQHRLRSLSFYNSAGQLLFERDPKDCKDRDYVRLGSLLVARQDNNLAPQAVDIDNDGIPTCDEYSMGLNPADPSDAGLDSDNDGLINLQEYENGTAANESDTDEDGMSDGYEVQYGLNPLFDDAADDPDDDSYINFMEFLGGSDPRDPNSVPSVSSDPRLNFGKVQWSFESTNGRLSSRPTIGPNGTIYITTEKSAGGNRALYAINPDGTLKWSAISDYFDPPVLTNEGSVITKNASGFEAYYAANGVRRWLTTGLGSSGQAVAVSQDGSIYYRGSLGALESDGTPKWESPIYTARLSPVVGPNGLIYAFTESTTSNFALSLSAFDSNGVLQWTSSENVAPDSTPAFGTDGTIYFGDSELAKLYAINPDGTLQWAARLPDNLKVRATPIIGYDGTIFITANNASFGPDKGYVIALNPDGSIKWRSREFASRLNYIVLGNNGSLYVIGKIENASENFFAIDRNTGVINLSAILPIEPDYVSTITIAGDGVFYATSSSDSNPYLYAFTADATALESAPWPMPGQNNSNTGSFLPCEEQDSDQDGIPDCEELRNGLDPNNGADALEDMDGDGLTNLQEFLQSTHYYNADSDGDGLSDGAEAGLGTNNRSSDSDGDGMPDGWELENNLNPLLDDADGDLDGDGFTNEDEYSRESDPSDLESIPRGVIQWVHEAEMGDRIISPIAYGKNDTLYFATENKVFALTSTGSVKWVYEGVDYDCPWESNSSVAINDNDVLFVICDSQPSMIALNENGEKIWSSDDYFGSHIAIGVDSLYISTEDFDTGLPVIRALNFEGEQRWALTLKEPSNDGNRTLFTSIDRLGNLYVVSSNDVHMINTSGVTIWTYTIDLPGFIPGPAAISSDGSIYVSFAARQEDHSLYAFKPDGSVDWVARVGSGLTDGLPLSPPTIGENGNIFLFSIDMYSFTPDGRLRYISQAAGTETGGTVVLSSEGKAFIVGSNGFYAIDALSGTLLWKNEEFGEFYGLPLVGQNGIYVLSNSSTIHAIEAQAEGLGCSAWPTMFSNSQNQTAIADEPLKLEITTPTNNAGFNIGEEIIFEANALGENNNNIAHRIFWYIDDNIEIGRGGKFKTTLPEGNHTITATVGCYGFQSKAVVNVSVGDVINTPPEIEITTPLNNAVFTENDTIAFAATASDAEDGDLSSTVKWSSSLDGDFGNGASVNANLSIGTHTITASVTDSDSASAQVSVTITVKPIPNTPPMISIVTPVEGAVFDHEETITFIGNADDAEDGDLSANIQWSSNIDGSLGSGATLNKALSVGEHTITASVSDSKEVSATASVTITVTAPGEKIVLIDADFEKISNGFIYTDDTFRNTDEPHYAYGRRTFVGCYRGSGSLLIKLGGKDHADINGMSGAWQRKFVLTQAAKVQLMMQYRLTQSPDYEADEYSEMLVSIDGQLIGSESNDYVARITGDGNGGHYKTTGWKKFSVDLGVLQAGEHVLAIGGYNNKKTYYNEYTSLRIDDVYMEADRGELIDQPPLLVITKPKEGKNVNENEAVKFCANAGDAEDGNLKSYITWSSDRDGALGSGACIRPYLSAGDHQVTASIRDRANNIANDDVTVSVTPLENDTMLINANFNQDSNGFNYLDDTFRSTHQPDYASGLWKANYGYRGGTIKVILGGRDKKSIDNMSGGWQRSFTLSEAKDLQLTLRYKLVQTPNYEADEYSEMLISLNGQLIGKPPNDYVAKIHGDGNGGHYTSTGWQSFSTNLGTLSPGTHTLTVGGFNNRKTYYDESTYLLIDDLQVKTIQ